MVDIGAAIGGAVETAGKGIQQGVAGAEGVVQTATSAVVNVATGTVVQGVVRLKSQVPSGAVLTETQIETATSAAVAVASKGVAAAEDLADQVSKLAQKEMEAFLRKYLEKLWEQYHVAFLLGEASDVLHNASLIPHTSLHPLLPLLPLWLLPLPVSLMQRHSRPTQAVQSASREARIASAPV